MVISVGIPERIILDIPSHGGFLILVGKQIAPLQEFISRIRAAAAARDAIPESDIVLIARTDAAQTYGMDEALNRLKGAIKAGADVAFLEGINIIRVHSFTFVTTTDVLQVCVLEKK